MAAVGCLKNEPTQTPETNEGVNVLEVTSPSNLTKTTLVDNGDYYSVNWIVNDVISVNGQESSGLTVDTENAKKAVFTFEEKVSAPYCSVYPASAYKPESLVDGQATVVIPAEQTYVEGDFDPAAAIMIGYSETAGKLAFEHAVAYMQIKVTTTDGAAVKSVSIKGNAKEAMSGEFTANFAEATLVNDTNDESSVSVVCESGFASGKEVIIAIPARTYASGVSVTLTDVNGHSKLLKSTVAFAANAGVVYSTEMELKGKGIYSVSDYTAFANAVIAGDYSAFIGDDGEVNLMADLTLEGGNFTYVNAQFNGTFDGNGHTLTSPSRNVPLFSEIGPDGVVKNLNTAGSFSSFANAYYCASSSYAKINYGLIENCNNSMNTDLTYQATGANGLVLGCFVGQNGGIIRDCKNTGNTIVDAKLGSDAGYSSFSAPCIAGGFAAVGHIVGGNPGINNVGFRDIAEEHKTLVGQFIRCTNEGELKITVSGPTTARKTGVSAVGGICGYVRNDGVKFEDCVNKGNISRISAGEYSNDGTSGTGGILGMSARAFGASNPHAIDATYGYNTILTGCTNSGTILSNLRYNVAIIIISSTGADDKANRHAVTGGIVGIINGTSTAKAKVTNCTNTGLVTSGWDASQRHFVGGIAGYSKYAEFERNTMSGSMTSYNGLSVGVVGGIVGAAYEGVSVSGGSSKPTIDCVGAATVDLCIGLAVGVSLGNVSVSDVKVGGSAIFKNKTVAGNTVSKDNWESYIFSELSDTNTRGDNPKYKTTVTNVTWED